MLRSGSRISPNENLRFNARQAVIGCKAVSVGSRLLYLHLDDIARFQGFCWPLQATLADHLGVPERTIREWLSELKQQGAIRVQKQGPRGAVYVLGWLPKDRQPIAGLSKKTGRIQHKDRQPIAGLLDSIYLTESSIETSTPKCGKCEDLGRIGGSVQASICDCGEGQAIRRRLRATKEIRRKTA